MRHVATFCITQRECRNGTVDYARGEGFPVQVFLDIIKKRIMLFLLNIAPSILQTRHLQIFMYNIAPVLNENIYYKLFFFLKNYVILEL